MDKQWRNVCVDRGMRPVARCGGEHRRTTCTTENSAHRFLTTSRRIASNGTSLIALADKRCRLDQALPGVGHFEEVAEGAGVERR
ncbi:MAG: hypothetical protein H6950_06270 [Zoogloeaceae bacterium]|nr:hypothetical protein [Zoogloeaceae bacterium]MCW5616035.1 hypothetical protein [Rhodocyclaceae bacterium]